MQDAHALAFGAEALTITPAQARTMSPPSLAKAPWIPLGIGVLVVGGMVFTVTTILNRPYSSPSKKRR